MYIYENLFCDEVTLESVPFPSFQLEGQLPCTYNTTASIWHRACVYHRLRSIRSKDYLGEHRSVAYVVSIVPFYQ